MIKFPFDNGTLWEIDLDSFNACHLSTGGFNGESGKFKQQVYYADVIRGVTINKDAGDYVNKILDDLFKSGAEQGLDKFIELGKKYKSEAFIVSRINNYLTAYVNELLVYVCNIRSAIEDFFHDFEELKAMSGQSAGIRFVLNLVESLIKTFIEINKDEPTRLQLSPIQDNTNELSSIYRIRVAFTKAGTTFYRSLFTTEGITPVADKLGVYVSVPNNTVLHGIITENLGGAFVEGNRLVRVYYDNQNSTQGLGKLTVFRCMSDDYKIRLL